MVKCPIDGRIQVGNLIRSTGRFTNALDSYNPIDPSEVYVRITNPLGVVNTYQYTVDSEVVRDGTGVYYTETLLDEPGDWTFKWFSNSTTASATEVTLTVLSTLS